MAGIYIGNLSTSTRWMSYFIIEIYTDEAMTQIVDQTTVMPVWNPTTEKNYMVGYAHFDNVAPGTTYYCRAGVCILQTGKVNWSNLVPVTTDTGGSGTTLNGTVSGNNGNGYWEKSPTGRIQQWGTGTGQGWITFPVPFTDASTVVVNVNQVYTSGDTRSPGVGGGANAPTTTEFFCTMDSGVTGVAVNWSATGY